MGDEMANTSFPDIFIIYTPIPKLFQIWIIREIVVRGGIWKKLSGNFLKPQKITEHHQTHNQEHVWSHGCFPVFVYFVCDAIYSSFLTNSKVIRNVSKLVNSC